MRWPADRPIAPMLLLIVGASLGGCERPAQGGAPLPGSEPVVLDGSFGDWSGATLLADDPADAPESPVDLRAIHAQDDPSWLYLSVDMGREVSAQSLPGTVVILLDTDDRPETGVSRWGLPGVDLAVELSYVADPGSGERGLGFALRGPGEDAEAVRPYALGLVAAPTSSARRFELRLARGGSNDPALPSMGPRLRMLTAYVEGGEELDRTEAATYTFAGPTSGVRDTVVPSARERMTRRSGEIRIAQLNVATRSFTRQMEDFARLLAAVEPDVLLLDELPGDITRDDLSRFFATPSLRTLGTWDFLVGVTGGPQRAAVATRLDSIRPAARLLELAYPDGSIDALRVELPDFGEALVREEARGISAAGGWVPVGARDVLFVALDLQSRGWMGSPHDRLRALQASVIRRALEGELREAGLDRPAPDARAPAVAAVVGGDFNLVGSHDPLDILSGSGGESPWTLQPVAAGRLGERTEATWRDPGQWFGPGRLDFVLVSPATLEASKAFVFATEDLKPDHLASLGLEADLSGRLSDHLVVVADLRPR